MSESELNALMINVAYYANSSEPLRTARDKYLQRLEGPGGKVLRLWTLEVANRKAAVFRHSTSGDIKIAIRGTVNATDALVDAGLTGVKALVWLHGWAAAVCKLYYQALKEFDPKQVTFVGHSLGGLVAEYLASKFGCFAHSYNAARVLGIWVKPSPNITCHLVKGDPFSTFPNHPGKKVYHPCRFSGLIGPHRLGNFLPQAPPRKRASLRSSEEDKRPSIRSSQEAKSAIRSSQDTKA